MDWAQDRALQLTGWMAVCAEAAGAFGAFYRVCGPRRPSRDVAGLDAKAMRDGIAGALRKARDEGVSDGLKWNKATEGTLFEDGDVLLVRVPLADGTAEHHVITIACDEDSFAIKCNAEMWCWEWADVSEWTKLPKAAKAVG